jgi:glycerol kinase
MAWLLEHGHLDEATVPALATVDTWIAWRLTGGPDGGCFVTDPSNASRTLLFDLDTMAWSPALAELFGVPVELLPAIVPSCGRIGTVAAAAVPSLAGVSLSGILGDQQAALFGQACFEPGLIKATYGTGAFVLLQAGTTRPAVVDGLLTTVAWDLGDHGAVSYALEGSAFVAGAAVQWLRDELGIIGSAAETEALARQATGDALTFVPAFVGLGSPWWDDSARGAIFGITPGAGRAQLARGVVDALAYEVRAITDAMGAVSTVTALRADGGAAAMDLLLSRQAEQSHVTVERPTSIESTAIGAATVAGLAEGVYASLDDLASRWTASARFEPAGDAALADAAYERWCDAVERSRGWTTVGTHPDRP